MVKHKLFMPMRYEISSGRIRFSDDGTPIWDLKYKEYHDEKDYFAAKPDSIDAFFNLGLKAIFNDEDFSIEYEVQGPREKITSMLASEFLGRSPFGDLTFNDLMAGILQKFSEHKIDMSI